MKILQKLFTFLKQKIIKLKNIFKFNKIKKTYFRNKQKQNYQKNNYQKKYKTKIKKNKKLYLKEPKLRKINKIKTKSIIPLSTLEHKTKLNNNFKKHLQKMKQNYFETKEIPLSEQERNLYRLQGNKNNIKEGIGRTLMENFLPTIYDSSDENFIYRYGSQTNKEQTKKILQNKIFDVANHYKSILKKQMPNISDNELLQSVNEFINNIEKLPEIADILLI